MSTELDWQKLHDYLANASKEEFEKDLRGGENSYLQNIKEPILPDLSEKEFKKLVKRANKTKRVKPAS